MMGITQGRKDFDFSQTEICGVCGRYGRYQVFMTYMVLSLFFIPCNTVYELNPEIGKRIARGEDVEILPEHLSRVGNVGGNGYGGYGYSAYKRCANCGFETTEDFEYCPKCGRRL